jgi:hypothetical protein
MPLFYFEGETDQLKTGAVEATRWELSYLKVCCRVQGIRPELFEGVSSLLVVRFEDVRRHFRGPTAFEDYWPQQGLSLLSALRQRGTKRHLQPQGNQAVANNCQHHQSA